jgi:hypothetical protein
LLAAKRRALPEANLSQAYATRLAGLVGLRRSDKVKSQFIASLLNGIVLYRAILA